MPPHRRLAPGSRCTSGSGGTTSHGVAVQTVYFAFRTKAELLIAAYDQAVLGSLDAPHPDQQDPHLRVLAQAEHDAT